MTSTAQAIQDGATDSNHAIAMAEADINLTETNQDWVKELTIFIFKDGSRLVINNDLFEAF